MSIDTPNSAIDRVYAEPHNKIKDFSYNREVAAVLPDMLDRTIPGYGDLIRLIGVIAATRLRPHSQVYDLGCALGAVTQSVLDNIGDLPVSIVGIDSSSFMIKGAKEKITDPRVNFRKGDIRRADLVMCDVVVLNFVLHHLPIKDRDKVLSRIRTVLKPGGLLIVSERIEGSEEFTSLYRNFLESNDYSNLEIDQRNLALENVMFRETLVSHLVRFRKTGFESPRLWFQCLDWISILAIG